MYDRVDVVVQLGVVVSFFYYGTLHTLTSIFNLCTNYTCTGHTSQENYVILGKTMQCKHIRYKEKISKNVLF